MSKRAIQYQSFALLIMGTFALRLFYLDAVPFRGDEAFSAQYWAGIPFTQSLTDIATIEPHPPLTYAIFSFWGGIFSIDSPFFLRLLSVFTSLLGMSGIFIVARMLFSLRAGWIASFIWMLHPFLIWHAQDFRNYGMWVSLSTLVIASFLLMLRQKDRLSVGRFILISVVSCLIFYFEVITLVVLWLYALLTHRHRIAQLRTITLIFAVIVTIPAISFMVLQGNLVGGGGYTGTTGGFTADAIFNWFMPVLLWGDVYPQDSLIVLGIVGILGLLIVLGWAWYKKNTHVLLPSMLVVVPVVLLSIIALRLNVFRPRYILMVVVGLILLMAFIIDILAKRRLLLAIFVGGGWLLVSCWGLSNYFFDDTYRKASDWASAIAYVEAYSDENDLVIQTGIDAAFGYYAQSLQLAADEMALPAFPQQSTSEIEATLQKVSADYDRLWIVGRTLPDWSNIGVVEAWAESNLQPIRRTQIDNIPIVEYADYQISIDPESLLATWQNVISLYDVIIEPPLTPDSALIVELYWQPLSQTSNSLTTFVHLMGANNPQTNTPLWVQDDHPPQLGRLNSMNWDTATPYRDTYKLLIQGMPDGTYTLVAGFYDETGVRLVTNEGTDVVPLGQIRLQNGIVTIINHQS